MVLVTSVVAAFLWVAFSCECASSIARPRRGKVEEEATLMEIGLIAHVQALGVQVLFLVAAALRTARQGLSE